MNDKKQPTPIPADEYEAFVQFVEDVHGTTQGHLSTEIVNALREYREGYYDGSDRLQRIEDDLAFVKRQVAEADTDGAGASPTVPDGEVRPRADSAVDADDVDDGRPDFVADAPDDPPHYNQPRREKAAWLAAHVDQERAEHSPDGSGAMERPAIRAILNEQYGFEDETAEQIVDMTIDMLGAEPDPTDDAGVRVAWGDTLRERNEQFEQQQRDEDADVWSDMDDAERGRR